MGRNRGAYLYTLCILESHSSSWVLLVYAVMRFLRCAPTCTPKKTEDGASGSLALALVFGLGGHPTSWRLLRTVPTYAATSAAGGRLWVPPHSGGDHEFHCPLTCGGPKVCPWLVRSSRGPSLLGSGLKDWTVRAGSSSPVPGGCMPLPFHSLYLTSSRPLLWANSLVQILSSFVYVPVLCGHKDTSAFDLSSFRFASQTRTSQDQFRH